MVRPVVGLVGVLVPSKTPHQKFLALVFSSIFFVENGTIFSGAKCDDKWRFLKRLLSTTPVTFA
jgi:hypothetical protein